MIEKATAAAARDPERRAAHRRRVLKGALVVFGTHDRTFDCLVRNLSDDGAKLTLPTTLGVPDAFELLLPSEHRIAPARTVWRTSRELGIAFTGPWQPHASEG